MSASLQTRAQRKRVSFDYNLVLLYKGEAGNLLLLLVDGIVEVALEYGGEARRGGLVGEGTENGVHAQLPGGLEVNMREDELVAALDAADDELAGIVGIAGKLRPSGART